MPELPEVETVRRGLAPVLEGKIITDISVRRRDLRIPVPDDFEDRLCGRRMTRLGRRAKYLLGEFETGDVLLCHLGMSGRMSIATQESGVEIGAFAHETPKGLHDHIVFQTEDGATITFTDHRRFGLMTLSTVDEIDDHPLIRSLGVEPLGNEFSQAHLISTLKRKRTPIKSALLDQQVVAGLGNIYVNEILFRARVSPRRSAHTIGPKRAGKIVRATRGVLREAIASGGSTLRDYAQADGELGYFQHGFSVYDRAGEPCKTQDCAGVVQRIVQSNRSTFLCSNCQR
jgi:formamidopyrimidine-DNA glycosylase